MAANDHQVGGAHYESEFQHWDWVIQCGLGYLEAAATKYVVRYNHKNGVADLRKAKHYLEKLSEVFEQQAASKLCESTYAGYPNVLTTHIDRLGITFDFIQANNFSPHQIAILVLALNIYPDSLTKMLGYLDEMIDELDPA